MKSGIIIGVIAGIVITVVAAVIIVFLLVLPATRNASLSIVTTTPTATSASTGVPGAATSSPTVHSSTGVLETSPAQTPFTTANVNFSVNVPSFNISLPSSVNITAQLTNTGTDDAHNVAVTIQVYSQGSPIKISGQDQLTVSLGTIKAGQTVTQQEQLSFGLLDGLKVLQSGATIDLTLTSDEKTETLTYNYQP
jgi:hypothetical protein